MSTVMMITLSLLTAMESSKEKRVQKDESDGQHSRATTMCDRLYKYNIGVSIPNSPFPLP